MVEKFKKIKLIPVYVDPKLKEFIKRRNLFAKIYKKITGKNLRPLFGDDDSEL